MRNCRIHAFTLIEIMIAIAIISVLAGILIPNYQKAREHARTVAYIEKSNTITKAFSMVLFRRKEFFPVNMTSQEFPGRSYYGGSVYGQNWWSVNMVIEVCVDLGYLPEGFTFSCDECEKLGYRQQFYIWNHEEVNFFILHSFKCPRCYCTYQDIPGNGPNVPSDIYTNRGKYKIGL